MVIQYRHDQQEQEVLTGNPYFQNFIESVRSPFSKRLYTRILRAYMKHYNYTDIDSLIKGKKDGVKQIESEIIAYLIKKRQAPSPVVYATLNTIKSCLVTFYAMNDTTLNSKKIGRYMGKKQKAHMDRAYTIDEIRRLLQAADLRTSVIILLLASTGMRLGAIPSFLKVRHIKKCSYIYYHDYYPLLS